MDSFSSTQSGQLSQRNLVFPRTTCGHWKDFWGELQCCSENTVYLDVTGPADIYTSSIFEEWVILIGRGKHTSPERISICPQTP